MIPSINSYPVWLCGRNSAEFARRMVGRHWMGGNQYGLREKRMGEHFYISLKFWGEGRWGGGGGGDLNVRLSHPCFDIHDSQKGHNFIRRLITDDVSHNGDDNNTNDNDNVGNGHANLFEFYILYDIYGQYFLNIHYVMHWRTTPV